VCACARALYRYSDLGVHVDGYVALVATTVVVGTGPVTGRAADAIAACKSASDIIIRMLQPGNSPVSFAHCKPGTIPWRFGALGIYFLVFCGSGLVWWGGLEGSGGVDDCVACGRRAEEMGLIRPWMSP
jgi:hypothetical protein